MPQFIQEEIIMKKLISVILCLLMMLSLLSPTFAFAADEKIPIVYLRGDGNGIYDADGNVVFPVSYDTSQLPDAVARVVFPHLVKAVLFNQWEDYYTAFENEIRPIFAGCQLDENGEPSNGSDISKKDYVTNQKNMNTDKVNEWGNYGLYDYTFWYDWRRDPLYTADLLNEYIEGILKTTGAKKVSLVGKCLGGSFVLAYLSKYGYDDIRNLAFDSTVGNGCEKFSDIFSGKLKYDGEALERYKTDNDFLYGKEEEEFLNDFILASIDLLNEKDVIDLTGKTVDAIYKKLYEGLTPRLGMAAYGTFPGYWSTVTAEDYQTARDLMFFRNNSGYAEKYAGLIEKLDAYDTQVRQRIPEILAGAKQAGINVGILAKYGYQALPILESRNKTSDILVSLEKASFGATCADIGTKLSEDYIAEKTEMGLGKYIAPDKQVDASTCLFPDSTWIIKGMHHDNWAGCNDKLIYRICTQDGYHVNTEPETYPQFMVYSDEENNVYPMTEENCNVTNWDAEQIADHSITSYFRAILKWLQTLFALLKSKIGNC